MIVFELFHTLQAMKAGREHERLNTSPLINCAGCMVDVTSVPQGFVCETIERRLHGMPLGLCVTGDM